MSNSRHNPGNVKQPMSKPWRGQIATDERGHAIFDNDADGIRAMVRTLAAKAANGKKTLEKICADWAPASDTIGSIKGNKANNPNEYADFVAGRLEYGPDWDLGLFTKSGLVANVGMLIVLIQAMDRYENGEGSALKLSNILKGIALYLEDFVEGGK